MFHFFAEPDRIEKDQITIVGPDVNHIKNVLRMKIEEQALISNGTDRDYLCEVRTMDSEVIVFGILEEVKESTELPARIYLFQGLPKGDKMELIIQKAVELGVYKIIPVSMKRSVVKLDAKKEDAKIKRWNAIAESAAKQSKRIMIPEITNLMSFREAVAYAAQFDLNLLPYECAKGMEESRERIDSAEPGMEIGIFIGPEGGFEDEEVELAKKAGVKPISLGRRILRTETAGLCILSVLMFKLDQ